MPLEYVQGESIFTRKNKVPKQYPYLTQTINTEVVVVGGGVTGSIVGYYFAKANIPTVILEKARIAYGSTSITTSLLQYELDSKLRELETHTTLEKAIRSYKLGLEALSEIKAFIEQYGNECEYEKKDTFFYTDRKEQIGPVEEEFRLRKENGFPVTLITQNNNPFSFPVTAGVYAHDAGAQLDPYQYTHQLLKVATQKGLKVYENTPVTAIHYEDDGAIVTTEYGYKVHAKIVIIATGFDTEQFTKRNFGIKSTTYNIATKPVENFEGWENRVLIRDNGSPYTYLRTTADNRIIIGGEDISFIPGIFDEHMAKTKYDVLEQKLKHMFPKIKDIEVAYKYCGAFDATPDNLGFLGKDPQYKKLWYCLGYGANGILFAILGGKMLSQLYRGTESKDLKLFRVNRFDF